MPLIVIAYSTYGMAFSFGGFTAQIRSEYHGSLAVGSTIHNRNLLNLRGLHGTGTFLNHTHDGRLHLHEQLFANIMATACAHTEGSPIGGSSGTPGDESTAVDMAATASGSGGTQGR